MIALACFNYIFSEIIGFDNRGTIPLLFLNPSVGLLTLARDCVCE